MNIYSYSEGVLWTSIPEAVKEMGKQDISMLPGMLKIGENRKREFAEGKAHRAKCIKGGQ